MNSFSPRISSWEKAASPFASAPVARSSAKRSKRVGAGSIDRSNAAMRAAHRVPGGLLGIGSEWACIQRHAGKIGQRSKDALIAFAESRLHVMRIGGTVSRLLQRIFERRQRLRPQAVAAAIPEEPGIARHARQRHGAPVGVADADRLRQVVLELAVDLMAGRAGHRAVAAHPLIEEQRRAECGGRRHIGKAVGGVGLQGRQR
jgi:hypothetical protein